MKNYEEPIIELVEIVTENIVCSSFGGGDVGDGEVIYPYLTDNNH